MSEDLVLSSESVPSADFEGALQDLEILAHERGHPVVLSEGEEASNGSSVAPNVTRLVERLAALGRGSSLRGR